MNLKKYLSVFAAIATTVSLASCGDDEVDLTGDAPEPPIPSVRPGGDVNVNKPKAMWIDAHANFMTLSTKEGVDNELAKIKQYGFNMIYLDVKPGNGYALYDSDILPKCTTFADLTVNRDWDYLGYFLEKCEELDIDVVASVGATGFGYQDTNGLKQGLVYDDFDHWGQLVQVRNDVADPTKVVPITDDPAQSVVMLDPAYPEVQTLIVDICKEIVTKYPKIKGISLDYLRYANNDGGYFGMSDYDLSECGKYWGEPAPSRTDIITASGGIGPKFAQWAEFRSMTVTNTIEQIRNAVKAINPDCEIHLWASADWNSRVYVAQNWASKKYKPKGAQYTDTYNRTGFADLLDVFITGAYTSSVWKKDNPASVWSVENFVMTWNNFIMNDCKCYGSIATYALDFKGMSDATYLCLKYTDGYMNFELSHQNNGSQWIYSQEGFERYEGKTTE